MKQIEMNNKWTAAYAHKNMDAKMKKIYWTPVLQVYGAVSKLTAGSRSGTTEGNSMKRPNSDP